MVVSSQAKRPLFVAVAVALLLGRTASTAKVALVNTWQLSAYDVDPIRLQWHCQLVHQRDYADRHGYKHRIYVEPAGEMNNWAEGHKLAPHL